MPAKRRCSFCFQILPAGRDGVKFCSDTHRKAYDRREECAPGEGERQRLLFQAAQVFLGLAETIKTGLMPLGVIIARYEVPTGSDDYRRCLEQTIKTAKIGRTYLKWAAADFLDAELSEANVEDLRELLNLARIDDPTDDDNLTPC